jgi:hypothetical protein
MESITLRSAKAQPVEAAQEEKTLVDMLRNFRLPPWLDKGGSLFSWTEPALASEFSRSGIGKEVIA